MVSSARLCVLVAPVLSAEELRTGRCAERSSLGYGVPGVICRCSELWQLLRVLDRRTLDVVHG